MTVIRRVQSSDFPGLLEALHARYPGNSLIGRKEFFDWQFFDPAKSLYNAFVAWTGTDLTGFIGYQRFSLATQSDSYDAAFSMQWFTSAADGTGIQLFARVMHEANILVMALNTPTAQRIYRGMGMTCVDSVPRWLGFLDPERAMALMRINDPLALNCARKSSVILGALRRLGRCADRGRFEDSWDYFKPSADITAWPARTGRYLNWRYLDIPFHDYQVAIGSTGMAVWRVEPIMDTPAAIIRLLEWTFEPNDSEAEDAMAMIVGDGIRSRAVMIDFYCTSVTMGSYLRRFGFELANNFAPNFIPWLFRPICFDPKKLTFNIACHVPLPGISAASIYLTRGDADVDRNKL